jgi:spermidine synthase
LPTTVELGFRDINHGVLHDPRVRVLLNDGRNVLLATREKYDAILSDSIHPVYAGNSTLYTKEYFELCRRHLEPGGVVSMWLPMYSLSEESYVAILRAFWEVFPDTAVWYDPVVLNEFTVVRAR